MYAKANAKGRCFYAYLTHFISFTHDKPIMAAPNLPLYLLFEPITFKVSKRASSDSFFVKSF